MNSFKSLAMALALTAAATPALADQTGTPGPLVGLTVNESSANLYVSHRGKLVVMDVNSLTLQEYFWGGAACNGKNLSEYNLQVLSRAVGNRSLYIAPSWKGGAGGRKCLVGYILAEPDTIEVLQQ